MQTITELAAALEAAYAVVEACNDDDSCMKSMAAVYGVEAAILAAPIETRDDMLAARAILFEDGSIGFADHFKEQLTFRLLQAI